MASLDVNRALARVNEALPGIVERMRASIQGEAWLVGGFVRDILLRRRPYDVDLALTASAGDAAAALASAFGGHWFPLAEERDTFRVALEDGPLRTIDVAGLCGGSIEADLALRDFTVDAMALPLAPAGGRATLVDPFGGADDLRSKKVSMVSAQALRDDPLRLLRGVRLAVELGFEIDGDTASAIRAMAEKARESSAERQRDELMRIFGSGQASRGLRMLDWLGLMDVLLPEVARGRGVSQPEKYHCYDVFDHCIEAVAVSDWLLSDSQPAGRRPRALRREFWEGLGWYPLRDYYAAPMGGRTRLALAQLATLLHDVSKPETRAADATGRIRFLGHSEQGAIVGREICRRFRLGNRETDFVATLIEEHLRPTQLSQSGVPTDRAIFRFFRALGEAAPACLVLSLADAAAAIGPRMTLSRWRNHVAYISYVLARGSAQRETLSGRHFISGDTLIQALRIAPGPEVGRLLGAIDEAAGIGEVRTEEEAIRLARRLREEWRSFGIREDRAAGAGIG